MIRVLDFTAPSPAENLALDEALLDACEAGEGPEVLRFWEPGGVFVVVGYANAVRQEVRVEACRGAGVPVLRRCSGGGTVVQMPGVLNYNLVLRIPETGPLTTLVGTNAFVMERLRNGCARLKGIRGSLSVRGITDLCLEDRKVMGNAQRRKRAALVFHGSMLLHADLSLMESLLNFPSKSPEYRSHRPHLDFCANLEVPSAEVKATLQEEWSAAERLSSIPWDRVQDLVRSKYGCEAWNGKF